MNLSRMPFFILVNLSILSSASLYSQDIDPEVEEMLTTILVERKVAADHKSCEARKPPLDYKLYYTGTKIAKGCVDVTERNSKIAYKELNGKIKDRETTDSEALFDAQKDSAGIARGVTIQNKFCMMMANQFYWLGLRFAYVKSWKLGRMRKRCFKHWEKAIGRTRGSCKHQLKNGLNKFEKVEQYAADPMPSTKREQLVSYLDRAIDSNRCRSSKVYSQKTYCKKYVNEIEEDIVKCSIHPENKKKTTLLEKLKKLPFSVAMAFFNKMINESFATLKSTYKVRSEEIVATLKKEKISSSEYFQEPYSRGALYYNVATHLKRAKSGFDKVAANYANNAKQVFNTASSLNGATKDSKSLILDGLSTFTKKSELSKANIDALNRLSQKEKHCVYGAKSNGRCVDISANNYGLKNDDLKKMIDGLPENEAKVIKGELVSLKGILAAARPFAKSLSNGNPYTKDSMDSAKKTQFLMKKIIKQGPSMGRKLASLRGDLSIKERRKPIFGKIENRVKELVRKSPNLLSSMFSSATTNRSESSKTGLGEKEIGVDETIEKQEVVSSTKIDPKGFAKVHTDVDLSHDDFEESETRYVGPMNAEIITRRDVSLWDAVSNRYMLTGWKKLGIQDRK